MKIQYRLNIKYPRLPLKFESGDIVYYNVWSKAYVREKFPHYAVDVNEVENNPDFWELIEEKSKPLFITEDGVDVFDKDEYFAIGYDFNKRNMIAYDCDAPHSTDVIRFKHESNADKYIEENKPKPLFITEDGVKVFNKDFKFIMVDYIFEKFYASYVELVKPLNTDIFKYFAHESNADEYIWRNKRVFSYEEMKKFIQNSQFDYFQKWKDIIEKLAKERSKQ